MSGATVKGRITLATTLEYVPFMFNPTEISDTKGTTIAQVSTPGGSDPILQWTGGGPRVINLSLWLDGDRGRSVRRAGSAVSPQPDDISIDEELRWYQSLGGYPASMTRRVFNEVQQPILLFSYGTFWDSIPCTVNGDVRVNASWFRPSDGAIIRATVDMQLIRVVDESIERSAVFRSVR